MASSPTVNINGNLNINNASVKKSASQVQSAFNNIKINPQSLDKFGNSLGRITGNASEFQKSMDAATARVFAFGATAAVIQTINQSFKALLTSTIQVEKRLVEINSILGASEQQFSKFRKSIFDVAKNTEQSFSIVADGAAELARQGLNAEETAKRLNAALVLTRISGLDSVSSVNALTAAINGYTSAALNAEQIVNKLVAVDTAFAVSAKDLADGFQRAGSTAEDAGVSFDELLGLITAVQQKTARGGAVIGNAFKSIFTRLSRSTTISELQELGVAIDSSQSGVQKLEALSNALSKISDPTQASKIKELAGGVFQINVVSAALKDLSSETSLFAQASDIAAKASNEAFAKNEALNKTLSTQINALVVGLTNVAEKVGQITLAPVISDLVSLANKLTSFLDNALSEDQGFSIIRGLFEGIGKFIQGPGLILITGAFLNIFKIVSKFAIQGFKDLSNLGKGQEKIRSIEQGIVNLLVQDVNLRKQLANASLSQSQKEQLVLNAIKQENALLREQQAIVSSLAAASARRGVASFSPSGGFKGKKGKRFAAGYTPEDGMMEVMDAVSLGASPSVKPQMGQGTIGGKKFLMNSQEVELPNFGMNGDSAVIPMYASGNIPRFAIGKNVLGKNPKQISGMGARNLSGFMATKKFANVGRGSTKADRDAKAAALRRKRQLDREVSEAPVGSPENRLPINAGKYGYLIPKLRSSSTKSNLGTFKSDKASVSYNMTGVNVRGPLIPDKVDKAGNPEDEQIKKNIEKSILDASHRFAKVLSPNNRDLKTNTTIARGLRQNRGAKGAVRSAVGSAFEVASMAALGIKEAAVEKGTGDFDVRTSNQEKLKKLRTLFNMPKGVDLMDFKVSASKDNLKSFAKKIFNENPGLRAKVAPKKTVKTGTGRGRGRGKASGFMPRFAGGFTGKKIKKVPTQNTQPRTPSSQPDLGGGGGGFDSGKGFAASFAITTALGFVDQGISSSSIKKVDELNRRLEAYKERLKGINKESRPEAFEEMRKSIGDLTSQIEEATEKSDSFSKTVNAIGTVGSIAPTLASFAPKGSGKAITKALGTPLGALGARGAATGAAALGGKGLAVAGGAGAAGIGAAIGARQFASAQVDESLASISDEDFSKEAVVKKYGELLNPLNTLSKIVKDENDGFLKKTGKILLVTSGLDTAAKGFSLLGASLAKVEEALPSEEALGFLSRRKLKSGEIREINTPEEAEAERQRKIKERKKNGPPKFDPKKQAIIDRARKRINPEQFAAEQTKTFGAFTDLNDRPTLSRRDATFNRIGFGGAQSQIAQKIASNQLNTNIKDLSGMEQVEQAKKRQAKDVSLRRQQSSIEFSDSIQVFNQGIKESLGKMDRAGTVTGAGAIQKVEQARQTAIERGFLSDALSEAALTFKKSSDPEALKEAFEQADLRLDAVFKSGSISEQERDKFRTMLENNLSEQSAILNQDVMDRKQLAIDSLKARVQAEEGIVNKLKASFESNLGKLDSNSSQVAADFSQTKTRSERDQFLKNLGISDEGRFQAAIADTTTGQFGQAAVAGAGTELRDYIKEIRASDPEGAEARLQKQFSSGQKQVLSEAVESSNIEGLKKRLFDLQGAKTARGGSFTTAGVTGLINNVSSAGLGDISSVADAERALNVLDAVAKDIGGLSGTKEQTQAQNEIGVQIAALKEKIEAGIGVAKVGIEEQQLATLKQIADNTAKEIAGQKEEGKTPAQKAAQEADKTKTPNMPTPEESRAKMMQKLEQAANDLLEQNKDLASGQRSASEALAMSAEEMAKALASGAISITETFEKLPRPAGPQTQTAQPQNEP